MNIFEILKNLYTQDTSEWIHDVDSKDISPSVIIRFLSLNHMSKRHARLLSTFMYTLPPHMFLSSAWSILFFNGKKLSKTPFVKYPKKETAEHKHEFLFSKIRQHYKLTSRDFRIVQPFIERDLETNMSEWFCFYGIKKVHWEKFNISVDLMKEYGDRKTVEVKKGLDAFF